MENIKHEFVIFQSMIDVNYRTMCHTLDYFEEHTHTHTHTHTHIWGKTSRALHTVLVQMSSKDKNSYGPFGLRRSEEEYNRVDNN